MSANNPSFVSWEEHIIRHERGNRVVHFYLKDSFGDLVLAVVGTERSIRHMMYVVSDEFIHAYGYGSSRFTNMSIKWRARREVVDWLTSVVSDCRPADSQVNDSMQGVRSSDVLMTGPTAHQTFVPDILVPRKLKAQDTSIEWFGVSWSCAKQLKHYPSFCMNGTTIAVHSFVYLIGEEENYYLGYLEDMYEDKKGQKKVKVRWFHHNQEVKSVITDLNAHPKEVFITAHVQVISAEYIDGLATVLTPRHYEKCAALIPQTSPASIHMCFRQIKHNMVKPFTLTKLRGYSNQAILTALDDPPLSKQKVKCSRLNEEDEELFTLDEPMRVTDKRKKSSKEQGQLKDGFVLKNSISANQITNAELKYPKLKLKLSRKTMGIKVVSPQPQCPVTFKVDEKIELLCQDSGIRGCWFRCKVLQVSQKHLKVKYDDVEDADGVGNLEEWVPASRVAAPDKLGIRCPGRLTIRPWPLSDSTSFNFGVGSPVDAWWSDGWWEGVVTGIDISGKDGVEIYLPGEDKFLTVKREDVRASKDWDGNKWVDVANPKNKDDGDSMDDGDSKDAGDNKDAGKKAQAVSEDGNEYANDI
ncbi:hypothetical protein Dsin_012778 [Dipteronia sinensis]|uniref:BAH domain-containing protein n=1 Tax=Dipteronia sinensis TaxID=43782 RepID=A0AAE0AJ39_9ROSI|nr:hypothetical protein Dsin_012778 [Dipteronia sinensis]